MNRHRLRTLLIWLLPLLAVRAIVPAGFMLSPSAGGLQLTLCSSVAASARPLDLASLQADHESHTHHSPAIGGATSDHADHQTLERSICPYAIASAAHAPAVAYVAPATATATFIIAFSSDPDSTPAPVLVERIRGPPLA